MKAILEIKQRIKNFYGRFDTFLLPIFKFAFALGYFTWINTNLNYMPELNNYFIVLILALICSILPSGITVFVGFLLMLGHCYAVGIETAGALLVLLLFMIIFVLRFSAGRNIMLAFAPLSFVLNVPVLLPIGGGLLFNASSALPAACGTIIYYFLKFVNFQVDALTDPSLLPLEKVTIIADGMVTNWAMWLNVIAIVAVIIFVYLIRTRSFNYAWRIAIVLGTIAYIAIMICGGQVLNVGINMVPLALYSFIAMLIGLFLEFFVFGGDYSRVEHLSFEDDDYYYFVKAVPKTSISTFERSVKKITPEPHEEKRKEEKALTYANPIFRGENNKKEELPKDEEPLMKNGELDDVDFKQKLEESLRDL